MGTLTLPINFLSFANDPLRPGDVARAIRAAALFQSRANSSTLGSRFESARTDQDADYVLQISFDIDDPEMREALEELAHELANLCWDESPVVVGSLQ